MDFLWGSGSCNLELFFLRELLKEGCANHYFFGEHNDN